MALNPRPSIAQGVQIGVETTEGTAVAAGKKLRSIGFMIKPDADISSFRPSGEKYATVHALNREWSTLSIEGQPTYDELQYLLSGLLKAVTATGPTDTTAYTWTFEPASSTEDTVKTYTVEQGGSVRAQEVAGVRINGVTLGIGRNSGASLSGDAFGQLFTDGITMTASPTSLPLVPVLPSDASVFLDTTSAGLGTTKLTGVLSYEWALTDRFTQLWTVNDALSSYAAGIEKEPSTGLKLVLNADADGMGLLSAMRDGSTRFCRMKVTSSVDAGATPGTVPYSLQIDTAIQLKSPPDLGDSDDVYAATWEFDFVTDSTWGKAMSVTLVNKQSAL